ncbi:MAG: hypothetical protein HY510_00190 [Acidobacteria bacterium]|nr:hypothetical protein [Acidobacteriota bacterium]
MPAARARRTILVFLLILTLVVVARLASPAEGGTLPPGPGLPPRGEEPHAKDRPDLFGRARVALFDPEGKAAPALRALGIRWEDFPAFDGLALYRGDLIVIGPGGFARGREALGPILAARARSGMRLLLLEQPSLPATLSEGLRLWPSFIRSADSTALFAARHPVLRGVVPAGHAAPGAADPRVRPLLPPARGNFRVIAGIRTRSGPSWQEGVTLLEVPIGDGLVLAAQESLCSDFAGDPRARIVLANALAYLLGDRQGLKRTFVYGDSLEDLPACLAPLSPAAARAPADLAGVEALLVPGDWRAPRLSGTPGLPPLAEVARYLREGGTVLLFNPEPMSQDYLRAVTGCPVYFESSSPFRPHLEPDAAIFEGISLDDLDPLWHEGRPEFRLRAASRADGMRPLVIAPGVAQYRVGLGTLVAMSLPDASDCAAPRTSSLLARLLTNLGVPLDQRPGIDPEAVSLLDE